MIKVVVVGGGWWCFINMDLPLYLIIFLGCPPLQGLFDGFHTQFRARHLMHVHHISKHPGEIVPTDARSDGFHSYSLISAVDWDPHQKAILYMQR